MSAPQDGASAGRFRDLKIRTAAAALLAPVVIIDTWLGGPWFEAACAILAVIMAYEWVAMVYGGERRQLLLHAFAGVAAALLPLSAGPAVAFAAAALLWVASLGLGLTGGRRVGLWQVAGVPYIAAPAAALVMLRADPDWGLTAVLFLFATVWAADVAAYFFGRLIGGPRLWPAVSPKKTWAGFVGAMVGSVAAGVVVAYLAGLGGLAAIAVLAAFLACVEQAGDLFESAAKRSHGVKDSGSLIPGHGGMLDRVDGLVAVAVAAAIIGGFRAGTGRMATGLVVW